MVSTPSHSSNKGYLGTGEGDFKRRYIYISSFKNKAQMNKTTLAKYVYELNQKHILTTALKSQICTILKVHVMSTRKIWNSDLPTWAIEQKIRTGL